MSDHIFLGLGIAFGVLVSLWLVWGLVAAAQTVSGTKYGKTIRPNWLRTGIGLNAGLISQNADPPYAVDSVKVLVHWLKDAPLRPAPLRSPGKPAN